MTNRALVCFCWVGGIILTGEEARRTETMPTEWRDGRDGDVKTDWALIRHISKGQLLKKGYFWPSKLNIRLLVRGNVASSSEFVKRRSVQKVRVSRPNTGRGCIAPFGIFGLKLRLRRRRRRRMALAFEIEQMI
tara:strand:+ start:177 stop:578 length:402 start_codon:yes stop_codon:yes gene_type:complete